MRLANKVALVTGASSGVGAAIARRFAQEGAKIVVADVVDDDGRAVAAEIAAGGGTAIFCHLDVAREADWEVAVAATRAAFDALHILVNNAGISGTSFTDVFDTDGWQRLIDINARGAFLGTKHATRMMRAARGGAIVNVSSISSHIGQRGVHMGYNASKAAVRLLTKSTAVEFGADNIRCNSIHPGMLPPMRTSVSSADPAFRTRLLERIPLGRPGRAEEVAAAALFLASDEASYITGAELSVDGGYLAC